MFRHVPNSLTAIRLLLAGVFFALLSYYQNESRTPHGEQLWLNLALVIYVIALLTDFLDGYLARRWQVEGAFGRITDPLVDKVLVLGSFIFFAGKNFTIPAINLDIPSNVKTISGVTPWMVVVMLARELLVTSLRGDAEEMGHAFGAAFGGKLKMVFQSITILVVLVYVNYFSRRGDEWERYARWFRDLCIWATIAITIISGLIYVQRAAALYRKGAT